jgi:hypothetical protein
MIANNRGSLSFFYPGARDFTESGHAQQVPQCIKNASCSAESDIHKNLWISLWIGAE